MFLFKRICFISTFVETNVIKNLPYDALTELFEPFNYFYLSLIFVGKVEANLSGAELKGRLNNATTHKYCTRDKMLTRRKHFYSSCPDVNYVQKRGANTVQW